MENRELEEKVIMMEELIQGFVKRMHGIETQTQEFFKNFLRQYKETLEGIAERIEIANKRYDDSKIQQQIESLENHVATMPKVIHVKNCHHFGAWSKNLLTGIAVAFFVTTSSLGAALYLNNKNSRLNDEAFNFWLVQALFPDVSLSVEKGLKEDRKGFIDRAEKAMALQHAILAAETEANETEKAQKAAKEKLKRLKSKK